MNEKFCVNMIKPLRKRSERGFTLAGVLVILTVVMVFVAYTVPKVWSQIMQREREKQTIYVMQQYARAIREFNKKHQSFPVSIDQLKEARLPRFIRAKGEFIDPLTGEVDWLVIPATAAPATGGSTVSPGNGVGVSRGDGPVKDKSGEPGGVPEPGKTGVTGIPIKDYAGGPFIGVRPPKIGEAMIEFRGAKSYEQWSYTSIDLEADINQRNIAAALLFH